MIQTCGSERQSGRLRRAGCHCFLSCLAAQSSLHRQALFDARHRPPAARTATGRSRDGSTGVKSERRVKDKQGSPCRRADTCSSEIWGGCECDEVISMQVNRPSFFTCYCTAVVQTIHVYVHALTLLARPRTPRIDHLPSLHLLTFSSQTNRTASRLSQQPLFVPVKLWQCRRRHAICYHCTLRMHEGP